MSEGLIYLDYNATTPVDPRVADRMEPFLREHFGNPSSSHVYGRRAKEAVERARGQVAALIGADPPEIVFTSGGSESNNAVLKGWVWAHHPRRCHLVTSTLEHPAVLEPCLALEEEGHRLTILGVDSQGRVDPEDVARALTPETVLVSVMHANNEVGTIQPVEAIARLARERGVAVHTDAAQSLGKIPVDVDRLGVDFLSIAGHKLYAPKGIGALYIRSGRELRPLIHGAGPESGRRAGTESVLLAVGLGAACALARESLEASSRHLAQMRDRLWEGLRALPGARRHGHPTEALPNTLSVGFEGLDAQALLEAIDGEVAASAGAACHPAGAAVSWVLQSMGVPMEYARGTIRLSTGRWTNAGEIDRAIAALTGAVQRLRQ